MIAEAATGDTVERAIQTRFFTPLGMNRTVLSRSGLKTAPFTRNYCWYGDPFHKIYENSGWNLSYDWTAGSLVTTAADMLAWTRGLFGGQVVSPASLNKMLTDSIELIPGLFYGYGCNIWTKDPLYHEKQISHRGENPGACADWQYYPESQRTIFLALNRADVAIPPEAAP